MRKLRILQPLNGQLWIAGEAFFLGQLYVDNVERILFIKHKLLGELQITDKDDIFMEFLDLEVPAFFRKQMVKQGWETFTPTQLFDFIAMNNATSEDLP